MLTHFTYKPFLSPESRRREYQLSFFFKGVNYTAIYHYNGSIDWQVEPEESDKRSLISQIHELMLFHVYEG